MDKIQWYILWMF